MKLRSLVLVGYLVPLAILYAAHPAPFILQPLVPATVRPGSGDVTLSITGTGFAKSSVVYWNSTALATTYVTSRQLRATIPAALIASPGGASIAVVNPAPGGGASNAIPFEVTTVVGTVALSSTFNPTGVQPGVVVTGDFNRDGKLDLATVNVGAKTISILLGNGDGTFQTAANYAGLSQIDAFATADFNGDGILDLVLPGTIPAIMFGNGDGSFQPPISIVLDQAISVAVGDVNGDGKEDLILGLDSGVSIWLGNGNGTFTQSWSGLSLSFQTEDIAITDLNNDGIPDIALAQPDIPGMRILLGKGDGTFTIGQQYSAPPYDYSIAAADLNGDGFQDLVVGSTNATITVYLGNGDGTFQPQVGYPLPNYTYAITLGEAFSH